LCIPWGEPPFPPRPRMSGAAPAEPDAGTDAGSETTIESVARTARYRLMFDAMLQRRVHVLATGHHADDQIETVLMRLGSGSTVLGLGGMRPVRRFGMAMGKNESDFGWFGHEGLDRWIVRPLLDVPKVRKRKKKKRKEKSCASSLFLSSPAHFFFFFLLVFNSCVVLCF
jgi:tRNA(Ile)-lysidine synthase